MRGRKNLQFVDKYFNLPVGMLGFIDERIRTVPCAQSTSRRGCQCKVENLFVDCFVECELHDTGAVAQVNEYQAAEIARRCTHPRHRHTCRRRFRGTLRNILCVCLFGEQVRHISITFRNFLCFGSMRYNIMWGRLPAAMKTAPYLYAGRCPLLHKSGAVRQCPEHQSPIARRFPCF